MGKLGYTWYPQDWWTSKTFKRLKRFPMVRYAIRELFDLMYKEGEPVEMNREYLADDFNIELSDKEYQKLMEFITVNEDGKWWIDSIKKRLTKAESARENGKKGGRPKKTQKPTEKTQEENPKNPPLEIEREIEIKKNKQKKGFACVDLKFYNEVLSFFSITSEQHKRNVYGSLVNKANKGKLKDLTNQTRAMILWKKRHPEEKRHQNWNNYLYDYETSATDWIGKLNPPKDLIKKPVKKMRYV